ncbi:Nn.00g035390.m01.CDS01 [Neocucurbitaria sp. VM-36]
MISKVDAVVLSAVTGATLTSAQAADILFGRQLYLRYIKWQATIHDPDEVRFYDSPEQYILIRDSVRGTVPGNLPSPEHFKAFMSRIKRTLYISERQIERWEGNEAEDGHDMDTEDHAPPLTVASLCRHAIHPGNPYRAVEVCPCCIMRQCVASLERMSRLWRLLGGPHKRPLDVKQNKLYLGVRNLWHVEKNRWANLVFRYREFAGVERLWEEQCWISGYKKREVVKKAKSCASALEVARQVPFLAEGWDDIFVPLKKRTAGRADGFEMLERDTPRGAESPYPPSCRPESLGNEILPEGSGRREENILSTAQHPYERIPESTSAREEVVIPSIAMNTMVPPPSPSSLLRNSLSPVSSGLVPSPPSPPPSPPAHSLPNPQNRVTFALDIADRAARPRSFFRRKSPIYARGQHACPPGRIWEDTSFMNDSMYDIFGSEDDEDSDNELERLMWAEFARDTTGEESSKDEDERFDGNEKNGLFTPESSVEGACSPSAGQLEPLRVPEPSSAAQQSLRDNVQEDTPNHYHNRTSLPEPQTAIITLQSEGPHEARTLATPLPRPGYSDHTTQTSGEHALDGMLVQGSSRRRSRAEFEDGDGTQEGERGAKWHCQ